MPHEKILQYLEAIESLVQNLQDVYVEKYEEQILGTDRGNLRLRIRFQSGAMLEVSEAVAMEAGELGHLGYRYHFQDERSVTIFRYDNTPHFADLPAFPNHKHVGTYVVGCNRPGLSAVFEEALRWESEKANESFQDH